MTGGGITGGSPQGVRPAEDLAPARLRAYSDS